MNKTLSIGLAGYSFVIEEHAYGKLSAYLEALRNSLDAGEADEVMHDIEVRIVEIFRDSLGKREVILEHDVDRVIAQIGRPEVIEEQEEAYFSENTRTKSNKTSDTANGEKQLFRDTERQKIAGVCAGLAYYTGLNISLMRFLWVAVFLIMIPAAGSALLIALLYVILWAILPKAETASDFLKMKGKPVNFDTLKEESNKIVKFANESSQRVGEIYRENEPYLHKAGDGAWNLIRKVMGIFFGILAILSVLGIFTTGIMFGTDGDYPWMRNISYFVGDNNTYLLTSLIIVATLIPALLFSLLAVKLLSPKTRVRNIGYVLAGLVLLLAGLSIFFGLQMAKTDWNSHGTNEDTDNITLNTPNDTLYVDVKKINVPQNFASYGNSLFSDKNSVFKGDFPDVEITRRSDVQVPYLIVKKEGRGSNQPLSLKAPVEVNGNRVFLPNFIEFPYSQRLRSQHINYELVVPNTTKIIVTNKNKLSIHGDLDGDGTDDDTDGDNHDSAYKNEERVQVTVDGKSWNISASSGNDDRVNINGKSYPKEEARKILDSLDVDLSDLENLNIRVNNGKKEISIKTK